LKGLLLKEGGVYGEEGKEEGKGRRRAREGEGKGKEGKGREGEGKGFAGPMSNCFLRAWALLCSDARIWQVRAGAQKNSMSC